MPVLPAPSASACSQPDLWAVAVAFDRAANGELPPNYPQIPASTGVQTVPPSVLKAVGWVESNWRQFTPGGRPLLSFDFGYGIMQITSGMAGAFGSTQGSLDAGTQSLIASNYTYNIAYGARMLAQKWAGAPQVGNGDPTVVEDWYYALWAYNGWGWVNNPNNPRFTRQGTPATHPSTYPYQERVLYLVAHPPKDRDGNPLWQPVPVTLPPRSAISSTPRAIPSLTHVHRQPPPPAEVIYRPGPLPPVSMTGEDRVRVKITNSGTQAWTGTPSMALSYHVLSSGANPWASLSPFAPGVIAFGQGNIPLHGRVAPGESRTLTVSVKAPTVPGRYQIVWDLESGGSWLSGGGVLPRVQSLLVLRTGQPAPTPTPAPTAVHAAPIGLLYVADTSVPDGTSVAAGAHFTKGWLVFNNGTSAWSNGLALQLVSGKPFGRRTIPVPPTGVCRAANLLAALHAPKAAGQYHSVWQLTDAAGTRVGDPLTLVVTVKGKPSGHPTPTPGRATPTATPVRPTATATPEG